MEFLIIGVIIGFCLGSMAIFKPAYLKGYDQGVDDMAKKVKERF